MREVVRIDEPKQKTEKPVEFTHLLSDTVWGEDSVLPNDFEKIVYLGKCKFDGDMFAAYEKGTIMIYKGHLNSGKY